MCVCEAQSAFLWITMLEVISERADAFWESEWKTSGVFVGTWEGKLNTFRVQVQARATSTRQSAFGDGFY